MLDAAWNVLSHNVLSIQTSIFCNIGIPIGFRFSLVEKTCIYNDVFKYYVMFMDVLFKSR